MSNRSFVLHVPTYCTRNEAAALVDGAIAEVTTTLMISAADVADRRGATEEEREAILEMQQEFIDSLQIEVAAWLDAAFAPAVKH